MDKITVGLILLVLIFYPVVSMSQLIPNGITASTDKQSYKLGERVTITGSVENTIEDSPITILVRNPIQNVYNVGQIEIQNKVFVHSFTINSNSKPGVYSIDIKHWNQYQKLQFVITEGIVQSITIEGETIKVVGNEIGQIKYKNVQVSTQEKSITMDLEIISSSDTSILQEFVIPKQLVDAPGKSLTFETNGNILDCSETETSTSRIADCFIPSNARELKITGTTIIPEFSTISILILVILASAIIMYSRKNLTRNFY